MPHTTDIHVGKRLREVRIMRGFTQSQLADALGVTFQQVQKYETGSNRMGCSRLWDICHIMDVPIDFFFEGLIRVGNDDERVSRSAIKVANELSRIENDSVRTSFMRLIRHFQAPESTKA